MKQDILNIIGDVIDAMKQQDAVNNDILKILQHQQEQLAMIQMLCIVLGVIFTAILINYGIAIDGLRDERNPKGNNVPGRGERAAQRTGDSKKTILK